MNAEPNDADDQPDYRFTLANERTFLAWIRTCLGLLAGSVVVGQFGPDAGVGALVAAALATVLAALAATLAVGALLRHRRVQHVMGRGVPLGESRMVPLLTRGVGASALLCVLLIVID